MNCCGASVTGFMLSHCVSHCSSGDVPQVQREKTAHLLVTTLVIYFGRLLHTPSLSGTLGNGLLQFLRQIYYTSFSMQGKKGVVKSVFCSSKKLNSWFSDYSHHLCLYNVFLLHSLPFPLCVNRRTKPFHLSFSSRSSCLISSHVLSFCDNIANIFSPRLGLSLSFQLLFSCFKPSFALCLCSYS